jgi:hypothetical protein
MFKKIINPFNNQIMKMWTWKGPNISMPISNTKDKQITSKQSGWNYLPLKLIVLSKII